VTPNEVQDLVKQSMPNAKVQAQDYTGSGDHFQITVVSKAFEGKALIEQHQSVNQALAPALDDGRLHAVQIRTDTPASWEKKRAKWNDFNIIEEEH
jgi:acid stress-induced BolA-like protein IbaG/YrbA